MAPGHGRGVRAVSEPTAALGSKLGLIRDWSLAIRRFTSTPTAGSPGHDPGLLGRTTGIASTPVTLQLIDDKREVYVAGNETRSRDLNLGKIVVQIAYLIGFPTNFAS